MLSYALAPLEEVEKVPSRRRQNTIDQIVSFSGVGLFSGERIKIRCLPADEGLGIVFRRVDLPGKITIPATVDYIWSTPRCTILGSEGSIVQTVEHLLSAAKACSIDNMIVEINGPEVPIADGSSLPFIEMFHKATVRSQSEMRDVYKLRVPIFWSRNEVNIIALPSDDFKVSYTLRYPDHPLLDAQHYSLMVDKESYIKQIAPARTFSLYEEVEGLLDQNVIRGGSLENSVVIKGSGVMNPEGLRFNNEPVRHKILDLIGDLSLVPFDFSAHIISIRSGHCSNVAFARTISNHITTRMKYGRDT